MKILDIKIDNITRKEILEKIEGFLGEEKFHQVATVNPEFILEAQKDEEFRNILNACDLNVADGVGIWFAFLRFGKFLKSRMAGADLVEEILKLAERNNHKVFLVTNGNALSSWEESKMAILNKYPDLKISGALLDTGCPMGIECERHPVSEGIKNCEIVLCSFGAPHQEKFLHSLKSQKDSKIRLAMGVGGSFDFLTGKRKRAPKIMRKVGLEWLWRFAQEPIYRAKRIWKAVIIFPIKIIIN